VFRPCRPMSVFESGRNSTPQPSAHPRRPPDAGGGRTVTQPRWSPLPGSFPPRP
jgi:hypothetical protein